MWRGSTWYKYGVMDVINPARFGTDGGTIRYRDLMRYIYRVVYRTCCCFSPRSLSLSLSFSRPLFLLFTPSLDSPFWIASPPSVQLLSSTVSLSFLTVFSGLFVVPIHLLTRNSSPAPPLLPRSYLEHRQGRHLLRLFGFDRSISYHKRFFGPSSLLFRSGHSSHPPR